MRTFAIENTVGEKEFFSENASDLSADLTQKAYDEYMQKCDITAQRTYPIVKEIHDNLSRKFEDVAVPYTDGKKTFTALANIKKSVETKGKEIMRSVERGLALAIIDDSWKEHLREMDDLKTSVQNAVYEQKDPLLIYKFESMELFRQMQIKINKDLLSFLTHGRIPLADEQNISESERVKTKSNSNLKTSRESDIPGAQHPKYHDPSAGKTSNEPVRVEKKVGRNEPCPCGSGKKYKNCHGKNGGE
jgi:preprotein translocase subunit SecA